MTVPAAAVLRFPQPLDLKYNDDGTFTLQSLFTFTTKVRGFDQVIVVPKGFTTDFASIPRVLWNILPPADPHWGKAAVIHDFLYGRHGDVFSVATPLTRLECDKVLREGAAVLGANWLARQTIFAGVRLGGWVFFKQTAK